MNSEKQGALDDYKDIVRLQCEAAELFKLKTADYGSSYKHFGSLGVFIRLSDKFYRMDKIMRTKETLINDECLRDTALDMINYATMFVQLLDQEKGNSKVVPLIRRGK